MIKVRCIGSRLHNKAIFQKEKLMVLHTILFSLYLILITLAVISYDVEISIEDV